MGFKRALSDENWALEELQSKLDFMGNMLGYHLRICVGNVLFGGILLLGSLCKVPNLSYALYAYLNLNGVVLHFDGYAKHLRYEIICNDDYYMYNANIVELYGMPSRLGFGRCQPGWALGRSQAKLSFVYAKQVGLYRRC